MNKKGFTLIEIIITVTILVSLGLVITLGINKMFDKSSEESYEVFESKIISSADLYLANNQILINDLQTKRGWIDFTVKELISSGFIDENIIDPSTNEKVDINEKVRISLDSDGLYRIEFKPTDISEPYLEGRTINLKYKEAVTCDDFKNYENEWKTSNLRAIDENGFVMDINSDIIKEVNCNINTSVPGSYKIEYIYQIPPLNNTKSYHRPVIVQSSPDDIVNLEVEVTRKIGGSTGPGIPTFIINEEIIFIVRGEKRTGEIVNLTSDFYKIEGSHDTKTVGTKNPLFTYTGKNSDGSIPTGDVTYNVIFNPEDIVKIRINVSSSYCYGDYFSYSVQGQKRNSTKWISLNASTYNVSGGGTSSYGSRSVSVTFTGNNSDGTKPTGSASYQVVDCTPETEPITEETTKSTRSTKGDEVVTTRYTNPVTSSSRSQGTTACWPVCVYYYHGGGSYECCGSNCNPPPGAFDVSCTH